MTKVLGQAERTIRDHQREASAAKNAFADELERRRLLREGWSQEAIAAHRRFGTPASLLYAYVGVQGGIASPLGQGTLLQALADSPGRGGAMVLPLRPQAWITEYPKEGKPKRRAAAVFVSVKDVKPFVKGDR